MLGLIVVDISIFFSSHASMGASVDMLINVFGDNFRYNTIFPFGLGYSLVNLWTACAVTLVTFLATFSGGWVYLKLLLMSLLWCTPPTMLSSKQRGRLFHYLDLFGKWSLLDLLVLTQSMVGFYVRIKHPSLEILPVDNFYALDLIVTPAYGLYSFSLAITLSLVLSHVQVVYHNKAMAYDKQQRQRHDHPPTSLETIPDAYDVIPSDTHHQDNQDTAHSKGSKSSKGTTLEEGDDQVISVSRLSQRSGSRKCLHMLLPLMALSIMCVGAIEPTWTFHVRGMVGLLAEFGEPGSTIRTYSFYSAIEQLVEQSTLTTPSLSAVGVLTIMVVYSAFSFVIPCVHLLSLFVLEAIPMTYGTVKKVFFVTHILSSFAAMEVWILATVVTVLQIQFVSYSVLDAQCTNVLPLFRTFANYGFIDMEDANCFQIDGHFEWMGMVLLLCSVVLKYFSSRFIMQDAENVIDWRRREGKEEKGGRVESLLQPRRRSSAGRSSAGSINY